MTHLTPRLQLRACCVAWAICALLTGCATESACKKDPITGSQRCQNASGDPGQAVGTAAVAAGAWTVAGCTVNGCEPPFTCNAQTKMCERIRCDEGKGACPPAYVCDPEDHVCK
ncbi:MAG TPA: hypothetical protein VK509_08955 [Polyangiales bacterium]|nr:hypothetical protein [Polyangiales bacterium]